MIEVELKDDEVTRLLERLTRHLSDMSQVMNSIGEQLEHETEQRFEAGVAPDGTPWAPKSAATIAAYERRGRHNSRAGDRDLAQSRPRLEIGKIVQ